MQITDNHCNTLELPPATRLSVCSVCLRFQIPIDPRREELGDTMHYRAMGIIGQRANSRTPDTDRPWCRDCRKAHFDRLAIQQQEAV